MRPLFPRLLGFLLLASLGLAQTQDQQKFRVIGSVVNSATGEPVRGALVELNGPDHRSGMSGIDGRFEMDDVLGGQAFINAQRPGFMSQQTQQFVTVGASLESFVVKLDPLSSISGHIMDTDGEPVDGIAIQCLREFIVNGRKQWQAANGATTDETGQFLIEDVPAGTYILRTQQKPLYMAVPHKSEASRYVYPATYYPDANSRDLAQRLEIGPGQQLKIDMSARAIRAAHVSLTTVPPSPFVMASISNGDDQGEQAFAQMNRATGILTIAAVPPGSWKLLVNGPFGGGGDGQQTMHGELPIEVGATDLENLKVPLYKLQDIPVLESGGTANIQLLSDNGPIGFGTVAQNGESRILNVQPGKYRVIAHPAGQGCITSLTAGSQNLFRDELVVASGANTPPIQVVLSENCPSLMVKVNSKSPAFVIVTNFQPGYDPSAVGVSGQSVTLSNLTPGEYIVYAFDEITDLEYANPDVMRSFKSQMVQLEAGQGTSVQLDINERRAR